MDQKDDESKLFINDALSIDKTNKQEEIALAEPILSDAQLNHDDYIEEMHERPHSLWQALTRNNKYISKWRRYFIIGMFFIICIWAMYMLSTIGDNADNQGDYDALTTTTPVTEGSEAIVTDINKRGYMMDGVDTNNMEQYHRQMMGDGNRRYDYNRGMMGDSNNGRYAYHNEMMGDCRRDGCCDGSICVPVFDVYNCLAPPCPAEKYECVSEEKINQDGPVTLYFKGNAVQKREDDKNVDPAFEACIVKHDGNRSWKAPGSSCNVCYCTKGGYVRCTRRACLNDAKKDIPASSAPNANNL